MKTAAIFTAAALLLSSIAVQAQDDVLDNTPSAGAMAVDLLLIRPVSLVGTVLGLGVFILDLPLAAIQGELPREPARKLVVEPFEYTFSRPLGDTRYGSTN